MWLGRVSCDAAWKLVLASLCSLLWCQVLRGATLVNSTADICGGCGSSASYTLVGSVGSIGGVSSASAHVLRHGYIGQLTEVGSVSVASAPAAVYECRTTQLSGVAWLDDDTVTVLSGGEIEWGPPAWPLAGISPGGVATAAVVYADTPATVTGSFLGVSGRGSVMVLDADPDNYGSYAGDGLADWWQVQYFGLDNPAAAPGADPDGDGQNNLFEFVAGVVPINAASVFRFRIEPVPGQPTHKRLVISPRVPERIYTVFFRTNPDVGGSWERLGNVVVTDNDTERIVTDLEATNSSRFYRVKITYYPDNLGSYAGDGLPDWWQVQFFGLDNPSGAPESDPDGDGQNNLLEFIAGSNPTNAASRFWLRLEPVPGAPAQKRLVFGPYHPDRTYAAVFATNLVGESAWARLTALTETNVGLEWIITDLHATEQVKFYRVEISYP